MHYYSTKQYSYPGTPASNGSNRNALLFRDPTVDGLKTGHTNAAGYCLVATAKRDLPNVGQRRLLSIVLGTASEKARANESQKLLNWGYTAFDAVKLFDADQPVATPAVWKGAANAVKIGKADGAVVVTVPSGTGGKLTTEVVRQDPLIAPLPRASPWACSRSSRARMWWPRCRWWRWRPSSRPASSAVCGTPSASGSSKFPGRQEAAPAGDSL
jgi:D-alanyl-D-alanine carboxypeptidase (penicillin-binding protein 5/6)